MSSRLPAGPAGLFRRVEEVLHYLWDPIGVAGVPEAHDEYNGYVPHVFSLLVHRASASDIIDFLVQVEVQSMGLTLTPQTRERAANVTAILEKHRDLLSRYPPSILR